MPRNTRIAVSTIRGSGMASGQWVWSASRPSSASAMDAVIANIEPLMSTPLNASEASFTALSSSRTPNTLGSALWGKRGPLAGLLVLLLAGGIGLAAAISRLVTWPLAQVVAQAGIVAAGGSMAPLPRPGTREVAALSVR